MSNEGELFITEDIPEAIHARDDLQSTLAKLRDAGYRLDVDEGTDSPRFSIHNDPLNFPERGRVRLFACCSGERHPIGTAGFLVDVKIERGMVNHLVAYPTNLVVVWDEDAIADLVA
jgi:hypothetical protein